MKKVVSYVLLIFGLIVLALGIKPVHDNISSQIPQLSGIDPIVLLGVGVVCLVIGVILLKGNSSGKQLSEVPIYHGKNVVGYRRMKK